MAALTDDLMRRLDQLPVDLKAEFPHIPLDMIERDVKAGVHELVEQAKFHDFVPVLVHRTVRERLRASAVARPRGRACVRPERPDRVASARPRRASGGSRRRLPPPWHTAAASS